MDRVLSEINKLQLDLLTSDWVDNVYFAEFMELGDIPTEYESVLDSLGNVFKNLIKYLDECDDLEENSWATLSLTIPYQKLLSVIGHFINYGIKHVTEHEHRNNAFLVSRVYFRLLNIPGARPYNIYHSQLFAQSISCLGFPKLMCEKNDHSKKSSKRLTEDVNYVLKKLTKYVVELKNIILQLQLTPNDINFEDILSKLVDVTGGAITQSLSNVDKYLLTNVSGVIYHVINCMICNYGAQPNPTAIELLYKCIMPKLIAVSVDNKAATMQVRASYVSYSGVILFKYCKAAAKAFTIMLEHLCYSPESLERAECRTARAELVVGLMSVLPDRRHRKFLKWVLTLSTTEKILHRHIALEILSRLLNHEPEVQEKRQTLTNEIQNNVASNPPNGELNGETPNEEATNTEAPSGENGANPRASLEDDTSQGTPDPENEEPEDIDDDEVAGIYRERPHTAPIGQILRAVYELAHDASSTVRQRALAVLAESVSSERDAMKRALQELNGDDEVSRLTALGARCVCDERAVVRRAAAHLIQRLLSTSYAPPPSANDLAILVSLCRDAAITVRSAAITALGDLVMLRPSEAVIDAFLTGPVHQLSDPENKVMDQVKNLIDQIVLKRLTKYTPIGCSDLLPWLFLDGITRHNMRRHLQKACTMLAKSDNCISVRLVDILSSHLGAMDQRRDLQCLVLLTSAAPHVAYSDVGFVLEYYYRLAKEHDAPRTPEEAVPRVIDARLMTLVLELMSEWARYARAPDRAALRGFLIRRLASVDDGCRIPSASLAAELDPNNLVWANELMQLSEYRAISTSCLKEALRAADISLVAPIQPSPALLHLFLNSLNNPPLDWSDVRAGECVAGAGRLCIRSRQAASAAAPALAALLHSEAALPARINALLALCDISNRYTNIVEPLMGDICGCLRPASPAPLRRAAARSLTKLLLGGFLRLRTPLYYNYCALLADADHDVREPAEYYVTCCLTTEVIYHHFVDCVLHYNNINSETMDFDARQLIYDVMLQRLTLVQKLNTQCRLAREVLEHAADIVDDGEELPATLHAAMLDTIKLLIGPRMRLPRKPQQTNDVADIDELQDRITTNIVSHKMKRTVAEVMVPAVMRLHARLGAAGGQLAAYLVLLSQDLFIDYRQEIEELIENDEELVGKIQLFRENIAAGEPSAGNMRNLVTVSGPPEPETPKPQRRRAPRRDPPRKRALKI